MHRTGRSGLPTMPTIVDKRADDAPKRRILKRRAPPPFHFKREPTPDPIEEWSSSNEEHPPMNEPKPPVPARRILTFDSRAARGVQPTQFQRSIIQLNIPKKRKIITPPVVEDSSDEESSSEPVQKKLKLDLCDGEDDGREGEAAS